MMDSTPIRVVYLIDSLGMGGAERVLLSTLEHLDRDRFEPRVGVLQERSGNPMADEIRKLGVPVDLIPVPLLRDPRALPRVIQYLRNSRADLLHTQLEFSIIIGGIAARAVRIPCVSTLHTFDVPSPGTRDAWRASLTRWSLRQMNAKVITVSDAARVHHMRHARLDPDNVVLMYNGVDLDTFKPRGEAVRRATRENVGVPMGAPVVITVAVLREPKGVQYLIDALGGLLALIPDVKLVIVGEGDHGPTLRRQTTAMGLDEHVVFTGARSDIAELLAMADLFVLPTLGDVLPTAVAEAMAVELPVVASDVGGVPEMVINDRSGILVPPGDAPALAAACSGLLRDPERAHAMGLTGRELAKERFSVRRQTAQLGDLYRSLLNRDARPGGPTTDST